MIEGSAQSVSVIVLLLSLNLQSIQSQDYTVAAGSLCFTPSTRQPQYKEVGIFQKDWIQEQLEKSI